ncbi:MAG: hypothetical protein FJ090_14395 [Deltaproteobacteria bacterium]|nr:hypothetical protein [Deltaproteobacteria bacterium]
MLILLACTTPGDSAPTGDSTADTALADGSAWYGDVETIVVENCAGCHADGEVAPFPLSTYAEAQPMAGAMADAVSARRMPPWKASPGCNEYRGDLSLSDDEIARIVAWAEAGAVEGDPSRASGATAPTSSLSRVDFDLPMPEAYTPGAAPDDYRCFVLEWPETEGKYVTGYQVNPGDRGIVHHVVLYVGASENAQLYRDADAAEAGAGYTCFGGPGVVDQSDAEWLGGWAPGASNGDFPNETGIYMEPGSVVVMQMHYNTSATDPVPDLSSVDFMVEDSVANPAYIQPWADPAWLDGTGMTIPANSEGTNHSFSRTIPFSFRVHTANLHMHTYGQTAKLSVTQGDGTEQCLLDIDDWDFNWQRTYVLAEPLTVENPTITVECSWDNPTGEDLDWGEGTGDEMCLGTMLLSY